MFQYAVSSDVIPGVGRDARHSAEHIASHEAERGASAKERADLATSG